MSEISYGSCGTQTADEEEGRFPAASSPRRMWYREQGQCQWRSRAAEVRLVICSLWEDLEVVFSSVGLSGLRQVSAERSFDEAASAPLCGASLIQAAAC